MKSSFVSTYGQNVIKFEREIKKLTKSKFVIATNSGTSALHIACLALGLGPRDIVWTSPITFVASANCALYCGATVDFVDIDPKTYNLSIDYLKEKLIQAKKKNKLPILINYN